MTLSPFAVIRMMRMASLTSSSYSDRAMRPAASTAMGNFHPRPRKSFIGFHARWRAAYLTDHHARLSHRDGVGRAALDDHVALARSREVVDENRGAAHRHHAADVRHYSGHERAGVKVGGRAPRRFASD